MEIELNKAELDTLAMATGLLPAIKMVRDRLCCSLSDAKTACELVRARAYDGAPEDRANRLLTAYVHNLVSDVCEETGVDRATAWRLMVKAAVRYL